MFRKTDPEATKSWGTALLSCQFQLVLKTDPSERALLDLYERSFHLRNHAAKELLRRKPGQETLIKLSLSGSNTPQVREEAWRQLVATGPSAKTLTAFFRCRDEYAEKACRLALVAPDLTATIAGQVAWSTKELADAAADRLLDGTFPDDDELLDALASVIRQSPNRSGKALAKFMSLEPDADRLWKLVQFDSRYLREVREEIARRFPDSEHLREMPWGSGKEVDPDIAMDVTRRVLAYPGTDKKALYAQIGKPGVDSAAVWARYVVLASNEDLVQAMRDTRVRHRAWLALCRRGVSNHELCMILWNLDGMSPVAVWRKLKRQHPTDMELSTLLHIPAINIEVARMLLARAPTWEHRKKVIASVPQIREEVLASIAASGLPPIHEILRWIEETENRMRDE